MRKATSIYIVEDINQLQRTAGALGERLNDAGSLRGKYRGDVKDRVFDGLLSLDMSFT